MKNTASVTLICLRQILRPVIRFCLKRSIGIQDLLENIKHVLIDEAKNEITAQDKKPNVSRLSVMTGLHRRDVMRLVDDDELPQESNSMLNRIIGQWEQDKRFCTKAGAAKILNCDGDNSEFAKLVRSVSSDIHSGTILYELLRVGLVEETRGGVRLVKSHENISDDPQKSYSLLSDDVSDLISAVDENITKKLDINNLHARTEYDNVFKQDLPEIRNWLLKEGSEFHKRARTFLSKFDKDLNPHIKREAGAKVVLTAFSKIFT